MKNFVFLRFDNGQSFQVPISVVAVHRSNFMLERSPDSYPTMADVLKETTDVFASNDEVADWIVQHMDWKDLQPHAVIVSAEPYPKVLSECRLTFGDEPATINVQNTQLGDLPIGLLLELSNAQQKPVMTLKFVNETKVTVGLIATAQGPEPLILAIEQALHAMSVATLVKESPICAVPAEGEAQAQAPQGAAEAVPDQSAPL